MGNKQKKDIVAEYEDFGKISVNEKDIFYSFDNVVSERSILDFLTGKTKFIYDKDFSPFRPSSESDRSENKTSSSMKRNIYNGNEPLMTNEYAYTVLDHVFYNYQKYTELSSILEEIMDHENKYINVAPIEAARKIEKTLINRVVPMGISLFLAKAYRDAVYQLHDVHAAYELGTLYYDD